MAINAYSVNVPIRESRNTYVPLPFEEMYAAMQEKQKRYDAADAMEREAKRSVSALSTPIKGHSEYLEKKKQDYLSQAMKLHNSMPDKGSAEYKRKLQDIVDGFVSDPNINLINSSAQEWIKGRETAAKLMADGKYSTYQDRYNLNFNGVDPATGALQRYNFIGLKPRVDYNKIFEDVAKNTPEQSQDVTVALSNGKVSRRKISIKSKDAILGGINTALAMNPDAIGEMSTELGLDSKGIQKFINTFAAYNQKRETVSEDKFDASTARYFDEKRAAEEAAAQLAVPLSTIPKTDFRETKEELKQYIDDKGNIKPAQENPMILGGPSIMGTGGDFSRYSNVGKQSGLASKEEKISRSISQVERLIREKHADVYENFLHARRRSPNAKELALKDTIAYIQEQKEGTPIYGTTIDDKDQRVNIINAMLGNPTSVMLYSLDPKDPKEPVAMANVIGASKDDPKLIVGAKLTASPYGRDKNSGLPLQSYTVNLNGKPYVATLGTLNPRDEQAQSLYEVENLGKTAIIHNFEPDPLNYPELGNKRVAKMKVYLTRLSNGQYQVCGDDISGK
jgi:hypothetical protein